MKTGAARWFACAALAAAAAVCRGQGAGPAADEKPRQVVQPVVWPADDALTAKGREILREERRVFCEELRRLKEWVPDNMRGATSRTWTRTGKTMFSESHAIEHVPDMPPEEVEKIVAEIQDGARDTALDNAGRFYRALCRRIPVFAKGYQEYRNGEYGKAAETVHDPLTREKVLHAFFLYQYDTLPPMIYSTVTFFEGECYGLDGALHDAMVRYLIVCKGKMPLGLTFSATARMRLADMYERSARPHFGIPYYRKISEVYADALTDVALLRLNVRGRLLMERNPFRESLAYAGDVCRFLDRGRLGEPTQAGQAELLARMRKIVSDEEGDGRGNLQVNWEMMGTEISGAGLQEGASPQKFTFYKDVVIGGSDDWGKLKPREKQEIVQQFFAGFPDEYRQMSEEYYRAMSRSRTGEK